MNENQTKFLEVVKYYEELQKKMGEVRTELETAMRQLDYNHMCQDPTTCAVYKIVEPKGTFMYYRNIDYVRTAINDERVGSLSKKEAESMGFVLRK